MTRADEAINLGSNNMNVGDIRKGIDGLPDSTPVVLSMGGEAPYWLAFDISHIGKTENAEPSLAVLVAAYTPMNEAGEDTEESRGFSYEEDGPTEF